MSTYRYVASMNVYVDLSALIQVAEEAISAWDIISTVMKAKYDKKVKSGLDLIGDHAVTAFYDSYSPHVYNRQEGLINAYKIQADYPDWKIKTGPEYINGAHKAGNKLIYENSFVEGWHGGAKDSKYGDHPDPGTPWWRAPVGSFVYWLSPAAKGPSAEKYIMTEGNKFLEETEKEFEEEANSLFMPYVFQFKSVLGR